MAIIGNGLSEYSPLAVPIVTTVMSASPAVDRFDNRSHGSGYAVFENVASEYKERLSVTRKANSAGESWPWNLGLNRIDRDDL